MTFQAPERTALEYLVSTACDFLVELHQADNGFHFEPADSDVARGIGNFERGQLFWSMYGKKNFPTPSEAAVMFVNAFRIWDVKMDEPPREAAASKVH